MPVVAGSLCSWLAVSAPVVDVIHTRICCGGNTLLSLLCGVGLARQKPYFTEFTCKLLLIAFKSHVVML